MKSLNFFHRFILITLIALPSIASGNDELRQSCPSFMQQCGQSLKKLAKFAVVASALLSPEVAGRSFTTSSNTLPLPTLLQTPIPQDQGGFATVALNPIKPEIAFGGPNKIWLVDVNNPDQQTFLDIGKCNDGIGAIEYNDEATKLAYSTLSSLCVWDFNAQKITNVLQQSVDAHRFNVNGTQLVVRTSDDIVIWDLPTNKQTIADVNGTIGNNVANLKRLFNKDIFAHNNEEETVIWSLDNPSNATTVNIAPGNTTIFGYNEEQLTYYKTSLLWGGGDSIQFLNNGKTISIPVATSTGFLTQVAYCPETENYFYTVSNNMVTDISINMINRKTAAIKKLYNLINNTQASYGSSFFSQNGDKIFVVAGSNNNKIMQFAYIDLVNDLKEV